jgi:hypothetical protein
MRRICELGSTYEFQSSTNNSWSAAECFLGPDDLESATVTLIEEFGADVLSACEILEPEEEGCPRISAEFGQAAGPMIAMSLDNPESLRLLTQQSASISQPLPLVGVLGDLTTLQRLKKRRGILFLTQTVGEAALLRTFGLPAAPAGPLQSLNSRELAELAATLRKTRRLFKDDRDAELTPVLAGWQPGGLSAQQQAWVHDLAHFLGRAARSLNVDFGDIAVWQPTEAERDELEFVIRSGGLGSLWTAVLNSLENSCFAVEGFDAPEVERRQHPSDCRQALQWVRGLIDQEVQSGEANPQLGESMKVFSDLVDQDHVEPIIDLAERTRDPLQKSLLVHAAETTRTLQLQSPGIHRLLSTLAAGGDNKANADLIKQLTQRHRSVRDLLQLVKVIRK